MVCRNSSRVVLVQILVREQLEKPAQREQRRAELVRGVGDELLPRGVELRQLDAHTVERDRQLADLVVGAVDDRRAEVAARNPLGGGLEALHATRQHAGRREPENEREQQREGGREQQAALHEPDRRQRVRERSTKEHHRFRAMGDGDLSEVPARIDHPAALDLAGFDRAQRRRVLRDVPRALALGVGNGGESRRLRFQDVECDDSRVGLHRVVLDGVVPQEGVVRKLLRQRHRLLLELVEPCVDELLLERRDDDQVGGTERTGDDRDEREDEPRPDPAGDLHSERKR